MILIQKFNYFKYAYRARGGIVVKALRYKPAGRGFDSRWCQDCSALWPWGRLSL